MKLNIFFISAAVALVLAPIPAQASFAEDFSASAIVGSGTLFAGLSILLSLFLGRKLLWYSFPFALASLLISVLYTRTTTLYFTPEPGSTLTYVNHVVNIPVLVILLSSLTILIGAFSFLYYTKTKQEGQKSFFRKIYQIVFLLTLLSSMGHIFYGMSETLVFSAGTIPRNIEYNLSGQSYIFAYLKDPLNIKWTTVTHFFALIPTAAGLLTSLFLSSLNKKLSIFAGSLILFTGIAIVFLVQTSSILWLFFLFILGSLLYPLIRFVTLALSKNPEREGPTARSRKISKVTAITAIFLFAVSYTSEQHREYKLIHSQFTDVEVYQFANDPTIGYVRFKTEGAPSGSGYAITLEKTIDTWEGFSRQRQNQSIMRMDVNNTPEDMPHLQRFGEHRIRPLHQINETSFKWPSDSNTVLLYITLRGVDRGRTIPNTSFRTRTPEPLISWIPNTRHNLPYSQKDYGTRTKRYATITLYLTRETDSIEKSR